MEPILSTTYQVAIKSAHVLQPWSNDVLTATITSKSKIKFTHHERVYGWLVMSTSQHRGIAHNQRMSTPPPPSPHRPTPPHSPVHIQLYQRVRHQYCSVLSVGLRCISSLKLYTVWSFRHWHQFHFSNHSAQINSTRSSKYIASVFPHFSVFCNAVVHASKFVGHAYKGHQLFVYNKPPKQHSSCTSCTSPTNPTWDQLLMCILVVVRVVSSGVLRKLHGTTFDTHHTQPSALSGHNMGTCPHLHHQLHHSC